MTKLTPISQSTAAAITDACMYYQVELKRAVFIRYSGHVDTIEIDIGESVRDYSNKYFQASAKGEVQAMALLTLLQSKRQA